MDFEIFLLQNLVVGFCYMVVPLCTWLVCWGYEKKLTMKQIRRIVWINYVVIWLLIRIILIERGIDSNSASLLWPILAHWMLKKKCLNKT